MITAVAQTATAQQGTFPEPTYGGYPLAYCGVDPSTCGEAVATDWCRTMTYDFASEWAAMRLEKEDARTVRLDDGMVCRGNSCEAFAFITCDRESGEFRMPKLGAAGKATLLQSGRRGAFVTHAAVEGQAPDVPGCAERTSGVYWCKTAEEYQQCRTLMQSGQVHSCRAELSFDSQAARPVAAAAGDFRLRVESTAVVRVENGHRGAGRLHGDARIEVAFEQPTVSHVTWCDRRDGLLFRTTGPLGGTAETSDTAACDEPITVALGPDEDDLLVAYDLCNAFVAWGSELTHSMDAFVAGLFHLGSASPGFRAEFGSSSIVIAPYVAVEAPLTIDCRD